MLTPTFSYEVFHRIDQDNWDHCPTSKVYEETVKEKVAQPSEQTSCAGGVGLKPTVHYAGKTVVEQSSAVTHQITVDAHWYTVLRSPKIWWGREEEYKKQSSHNGDFPYT